MIGFVMSMMIEIKARGHKNRKVDKHESGQNHCEENSWVCAGNVMRICVKERFQVRAYVCNRM